MRITALGFPVAAAALFLSSCNSSNSSPDTTAINTQDIAHDIKVVADDPRYSFVCSNPGSGSDPKTWGQPDFPLATETSRNAVKALFAQMKGATFDEGFLKKKTDTSVAAVTDCAKKGHLSATVEDPKGAANPRIPVKPSALLAVTAS